MNIFSDICKEKVGARAVSLLGAHPLNDLRIRMDIVVEKTGDEELEALGKTEPAEEIGYLSFADL